MIDDNIVKKISKIPLEIKYYDGENYFQFIFKKFLHIFFSV